MTLTTTAGAADADSYVSVADADTYHTARGTAAWTGEDAAKEAALRRATAWLDGTYRSRLPGERRYDRTQALEWPRLSVYDSDGNPVDSDTIPREIVHATCEAAARELASAGSLSPDVTTADAVKRERVGPMEVEYAGIPTATAKRPILTVVEDILSGLLMSVSAGTRWLGRA